MPEEGRDAHVYFLVPSIFLSLDAKAVAVASVVTRDDGVDGTMTLVVSGSGTGFMRVWFPDIESPEEVHEADGPQVAALSNALAVNQ